MSSKRARAERERARTARPEPPRRTAASTRTGVLHAVAALVVGTAVAWGAVSLVVAQREDAVARQQDDPPAELRLGDRTREALAELRRDGVYVAPDGADMVDDAGEARIEAAIAANPLPVYVVVWAEGQEIGNADLNLEDQLLRELGPDPGMLYVWEGPRTGAAEQIGPRGVSLDGTRYEDDFVGDAADALVAAAEEVQVDEDFSDYGDDGEDDYWGGPVGGGLVGLLAGAGLLAAGLIVAAVVQAATGRGLPGRWRWTVGGSR